MTTDTYNFTTQLWSERKHKIEIDEAALYGYWEYPDGSEGGGLWFFSTGTKLELVDYDGAFALHPAIVRTLRAQGFVLDETFD